MLVDIAMPGQTRERPSSISATSPSYAILLSGTHVTGKETLAVSLAKALGCPWIKAEMAHNAATFGARSQAARGFSYEKVFERIWSSKLQRLGFPAGASEPVVQNEPSAEASGGPGGSVETQQRCAAIISLYHMRKPARDAIRHAMLACSVRPVFAVLHITKETLSGRTVGAEEPRLAERIMAHKVADIEAPLEEEKDVILLDSLRNVDALFLEVLETVSQKLQVGG
ncbi:hypothetical protein KVR01_000054 [Diaporthe batatas]|uniref:uncharacterized protein n=1 Tax=Diaporthe batatas TaxID=748121 RepID=UPI001D0592FC|nr:uncharacterized protein KVR01_000054 [Diaporthe batatas]KAG8169309.1 hypothetical protein KVR01_000054 [Diaporthe batatas]